MTDISKSVAKMRSGSGDRIFFSVCLAGTLLINAVVFGYLYGILETKVSTHELTLAIITQDIKKIPERLARIETILQQLVNR